MAIHLREGVKVAGGKDIQELGRRISLSRGTALKSLGSAEGPPSIGDAVIPVGEWEFPALEDIEQLLSRSSEQPPCSTISLVSIPAPVLASLDKLGVRLLQSQREADLLEMQPTFKQALEPLVGHIKKYLLSDEGFLLLGLSVGESGLVTATVDRGTGLRVGLHVDSWDRKRSLEDRRIARNRMCINLGVEARSFLFINLDLVHVRDLLLTQGESNLPSTSGMIKQFSACFPSYPVIRLVIAPGEAYIAPTECIIHDATTLAKQHPDINFTAIGFFKP